jgi:DNA-binding transcriptional ArsR family regulator
VIDMGCCYKAIADETRRKILELLSKGRATAGEIGSEAPPPQVGASLKTP